MAQCTATSGRKQLAPVSIEARWLTLPVDATMTARVAITDARQSKFYTFSAHVDQRDGQVMGYRLAPVEGEAYDLDPVASVHGWSCSCPDGIYRPNRPGGCRHVQSVIQLLASLDGELEKAEQARREAEQEADRDGEEAWTLTDEELEQMWRESQEEDALARGLCFYEAPEEFRFGVGA